MTLSYSEAQLFLRAGDDMRLPAWPAHDFIRWQIGAPRPLAGYEVVPYAPSAAEINSTEWSRA